MNEIYLIENLTSLGQVRNSINPERRVRVSVSPVDQSIVVSIVEGNTILVRVSVDSDNVWSLTTSELEDLLNSYGFNCHMHVVREISDEALEYLKCLRSLGYTYITRLVQPKGDVFASSEKHEGSFNLRDQVNYSYKDWLFLTPKVVYNIDTVIRIEEERTS